MYTMIDWPWILPIRLQQGNHSSPTYVYLCLYWLFPNVYFYNVRELMWVPHLPERAKIYMWSLLTVLNPDYVLAFPKRANLQCEELIQVLHLQDRAQIHLRCLWLSLTLIMYWLSPVSDSMMCMRLCFKQNCKSYHTVANLVFTL